MHSFSLLPDFAFLCVICAIPVLLRWAKTAYRSRIRLPYPPGPPQTNWIAGNISDMPLEEQWIRFTEWAKTYGSVVYFRALHKHCIVISDRDVAIELLERRSNNYSSRPHIPMAELMGWSYSTTFKYYGDTWRNHRRLYQRHFKPEVIQRYQDVQTRKIQDMLYQLLTNPADFYSHIRHASGAIIMSAVYDHETEVMNDHYVEIAEKAMDGLTVAMLPGTFIVNVISPLKYLPDWFPGTGFKRFGREVMVYTSQMLNDPIAMVQKKMESGGAKPCIAAELLQDCTCEEELDDIKAVCGSSYAGGADTSVSSVQTFFYAMANNPLVQQKAQEEIDRVIGAQRLPTFADRPLLSYAEALLRETLRWGPVLPLGVAHESTADDVYESYYIPKGVTVIANIWGMTRDPTKYKNPDEFDPSRFFDASGALNSDRVDYVFGFGRRICPGRYFASGTVWLSIVTVLAAFDIRKKKDVEGREIPVDSGYNKSMLMQVDSAMRYRNRNTKSYSSSVSHPLPFECEIVPRSDVASAIIRDVLAQRD